MMNLNHLYKVLIGQVKNIMKKLMPLVDENTKQSKSNPEISKYFLRPLKSEVFLTKKASNPLYKIQKDHKCKKMINVSPYTLILQALLLR